MQSRKRRKNRRKKPFTGKIFILITLTILGLFFYFFIDSKKTEALFNFENFREKLIPAEFLDDILLNPPQPVTPTPFPTPTPVPLIGHCLNVPVLLFHHVQPQQEAIDKGQASMSVDNGVFDQQMAYLVSSGFNFITAKELVDALKNKSPLSPKSILITFDDGYKDNFLYAYPVIQKYNIKANFMISTGLLEGTDYMSWSQIEEMNRSGLIYWTNHTWSHYNVASGNIDKIKYEINTAKEQLQSHTGQTIDVFTYPYGLFDNLSVQILVEENNIGAFSTIPGSWQCDSFIMALHRQRIGNSSMPSYGF